MIGKQDKQSSIELVTIEDMVRSDHLLRKVDKYIDFSFIPGLVRHLYCEDNGRPSLDPVVLVKMMLLGYMYGIRSERRLMQEIRDNVAYRWFLGYKLGDKIPDHSTISQNRRRRFKDNTVFQQIFDEVVRQAQSKGYVPGRFILTDSTLVKAKANKNKYIRQTVSQVTKKYFEDLENAIEEDRRQHGLKQLRPRKEVVEKTREIRVSTTDPDAGFVARRGKPECFGYSAHRSVDHQHNIITDVFVTPATVADGAAYIPRLERQRQAFGFVVEAVGLDAGYNRADVCYELQKRDIFAVIGQRSFHPTNGLYAKNRFIYHKESDTYRCPAGHHLRYSTTDRHGYRHYVSDRKVCRECELRAKCTRSRTMQKMVTRHVWEGSREWVRANRLSDEGRAMRRIRYETIERSFANAKELHCMRYARMVGLPRLQEQSLMSATAQNMKKIALLSARSESHLWAA